MPGVCWPKLFSGWRNLVSIDSYINEKQIGCFQTGEIHCLKTMFELSKYDFGIYSVIITSWVVGDMM